MSRLEELISELCPNGVEYKKLSDVLISIHSGLNPRNNFKLNTGGELYYVTVKEITSGKIIFSEKTDKIDSDAWKVIQNRSKLEIDDVLLSGIGTIGKVAVVDVPVETWNCSESVLLLKPDKSLLLSWFLKYVLESKDIQEHFNGTAVGSTLKGIRIKDLECLEIPVPPLPIQEEIVRILDNFTELTAELTAELQDRKKQYEYYRDSLLTFNDEVKRYSLNDISDIYDGTHQTPEYKTSGIPFISVENIDNIYATNKFISFDDYKKYKIVPRVNDIFMTRIGTVGKCFVVDKDVDMAYYVSLALIRPNTAIINSSYLKYYLESSIGLCELNKRILHHAVPIKINKDDIGKIDVLVPSLEVQERIVNVLDNFEKICNDLKIGLPAEIELRQKQYEYYRDMLLTFPENDLHLSKQASKQA